MANNTLATTTPLQKLLRLKEIDREHTRLLGAQVEDSSPEYVALCNELRKLEQERETILASVGAPPLAVLGQTDAMLWTLAFVEQFPGLQESDVYGWFANAIFAGASEGYGEGMEKGYAKGADDARKGAEAALHALSTIREGVNAGIIRSARNITTTDNDTGLERVQPLAEFVAEALQKAGK